MCAAAQIPLSCADSTGAEQAGSVSVPGEGTARGWCRSPCVTRNHAMLAQIRCRWVQSSAQHPLHCAGPVCVSLAGGESVLEEGDGKTFPSIPGAAGTCRSNSASSCPPALSFPWLSTLTFPSASRLSPQPPLLPAARFGAGGRQGGTTADEQPQPLPPAPSPPSPLLPSTHPAPINIYTSGCALRTWTQSGRRNYYTGTGSGLLAMCPTWWYL